ncbi:MAG: fluoride efflux transporter CrcB [Gammaproteobacteria bacterium]|nr:fluoride efflux transporter CrcB [Chromatiales bacterium]MCP4924440.1 fluoride efflux transporter CrcB [Gammaproteobacteria bacterium]MDP7153721.1 fluoride efflux transporter CrcB [Gammaproteobacteria bacterium]MDP7296740.1 fluoride efflux transporter CrcB [Gammaproteobacteria bacterium]MDP7419204.1 fluoride efflux transporter CrcB [Gammaproteobacteria bacterium]
MNYLSQVMIVGAGGFIGSALRFVVSGWVQRLAATSVMPYGTLAVNVLGCLALGFLGGLAEYRQVLEPGQRLFLMVGILGGFTTFSTFAFESISLMQDAEILKAMLNTVAQVVLGFGAAFVGFILARFL